MELVVLEGAFDELDNLLLVGDDVFEVLFELIKVVNTLLLLLLDEEFSDVFLIGLLFSRVVIGFLMFVLLEFEDEDEEDEDEEEEVKSTEDAELFSLTFLGAVLETVDILVDRGDEELGLDFSGSISDVCRLKSLELMLLDD